MDIVITGISFSPTPTAAQTVTIKYKLTSAPDVSGSYTVQGVYTVGTDGVLSPVVTITGLSPESYDVVVTNNCTGCGIKKTVVLSSPVTYLWVEDTFTCEQDDVFTQISQITGLSSPQKLFYDATSGMVYGTELDNPAGAVLKYNPLTATTASDISYFPIGFGPGQDNYMYGSAIDGEHRKFYLIGKDTGGIRVFDLATETYSLIPFGCDGDFARLFVKLVGNYVYATSKAVGACGSALFTAIDRTTGLQVAGYPMVLSSIPNGALLTGAAEMHAVNGEVWVVGSQTGTVTPNIVRYNPVDFTVSLPSIDISAHSALYANSAYWRTAHYDAEYQKYYVIDSGSNKLIVVDTSTTAYTVTATTLQNRQNKTHLGMTFVSDPITGDLFLTGDYENSLVDPSLIKVTYQINRQSGTMSNVYPGVTFFNLVRIGSTNTLHGAAQGQLAWGGVGWDTDGVITKFTR